jgi:chaperonin GroES
MAPTYRSKQKKSTLALARPPTMLMLSAPLGDLFRSVFFLQRIFSILGLRYARGPKLNPLQETCEAKSKITEGERDMNLRPLNDRVIVKRLEAEEKTAGGLFIPDTAKDKPIQGKVLAVGKGKVKEDGSRTAMDVKEGDTVLFGKYGGTEVQYNEDEYLILREDDILAIVE